MRLVSKLLKALLVLLLAFGSVRYSCDNYTSGELQICKYTAPQHYRAIIGGRFPQVIKYSDSLVAKYETVVVPRVGSAVIHVKDTVEQKVVPSVIRTSRSSLSLVYTKVYPRVVKYAFIAESSLCRWYLQLCHQYTVYVKPVVINLYYKTMIKYPFLEHSIYSVQAQYKIMETHVFKYYNIISYNVQVWNDKYGYGRLSRNKIFIRTKSTVVEHLIIWYRYVNNRCRKMWRENLCPIINKSRERFAYHGGVRPESVTTDPDDESIFYEDDDVDEYTETSTIVLTVTQTANSALDLKATPSASGLIVDECDMSMEEMLRNDFMSWKITIENKLSNTMKDFENDINEFAQEKLDHIQPTLADLLKRASNTSQTNFQIITKAIMDVNCTESVDPKTNKTIWFDQNNTQLPKYMTRELMREYFSAAHSQFDALSQEIRAHLRKLADEVNDHVEVLRQENVELFEEWADVMITEWSKNLAYVDVAVNEEKLADLEKEQRKNWKDFMKLKRQVIKTRDTLMEHPVKLDSLQSFVNTVQQSLKTLSHENGEYLYILRSKANLEFQAREALERQQREKEKAESASMKASTEFELSSSSFSSSSPSTASSCTASSTSTASLLAVEKTIALEDLQSYYQNVSSTDSL